MPFFICALSLIGYFFTSLGRWVLVFGLMRYSDIYILMITPVVINLPRVVSTVEKTACAASVIVLLVILAPFGSIPMKRFLGITGLFILGLSFLLDFIFRMARGERSGATERFL